MDRLAAMQAFVNVVASGSFVKAAEKLGASTSGVSRAVAELETHLGVRLLHRTTRRLSLTDTGQSYFERCVQVLADIAEADSAAASTSVKATGTLKITCPYNLLAQPLGPAFAAFAALHPGVTFDVSVSDRVVNLIEEGFDLAVRIGAPGGDRVVAKRLGSTQLLACAAPQYLRKHGRPRDPAALAEHQALIYTYSASPNIWRLADNAGRVLEVKVDGALRANSGDLLVVAAIEGMGIVFEPDFVVGPALADGSLLRILPDYAGPPLEVWAVYPSRRHLSAKLRLFVDHLAQVFAADPLRRKSMAGTPARLR